MALKTATVESQATDFFLKENAAALETIHIKQLELAIVLKKAAVSLLAELVPEMGKMLVDYADRKRDVDIDMDAVRAKIQTLHAHIIFPPKMNFSKYMGKTLATDLAKFVTGTKVFYSNLMAALPWISKMLAGEIADPFDEIGCCFVLYARAELQGAALASNENNAANNAKMIEKFDIACLAGKGDTTGSEVLQSLLDVASVHLATQIYKSTSTFVDFIKLANSFDVGQEDALFSCNIVGDQEYHRELDFRKAVKLHFSDAAGATMCFKDSAGSEAQLDVRSVCLAGMLLPVCKHAVHFEKALEFASLVPALPQLVKDSMGSKDPPKDKSCIIHEAFNQWEAAASTFRACSLTFEEFPGCPKLELVLDTAKCMMKASLLKSLTVFMSESNDTLAELEAIMGTDSLVNLSTALKDESKEIKAVLVLPMIASASAVALYTMYHKYLPCVKRHAAVLDLALPHLVPGASWEDVALAKDLKECWDKTKVDHTNRLASVKLLIADMTGLQAALRALNPGESRKALISTCKVSFPKKGMVCSVRITAMLDAIDGSTVAA
jgi:hypothetical protein